MKPILISSDWHLRSDCPRTRVDDNWLLTQKQAIRFLVNTANEHNADLYVVGDVFHRPVTSTEIEVLLISELCFLKGNFYSIAGNHDLPGHTTKNIDQSSYGILHGLNGKMFHKIPNGRHFDEDDSDVEGNILFKHILVFNGESAFGDGFTAQALLEKYPDKKFIFTGDNHEFFTFEHKGRKLVNLGTMLRQKWNEKDFSPKCVLFDGENLTEISIPDNAKFVKDKFMLDEAERQNHISAFVEALENILEFALDFEQKVDKVVEKTKPHLMPLLEEVKKYE